MLDSSFSVGNTIALPKLELDALLTDLRANGYRTIGPRLQDESIVYKEIEGLKDMPRGITSEQLPASYRLIRTGKGRYFDFIPASQSWKQFLFPPRTPLFQTVRNAPIEQAEGHWQVVKDDEPAPQYALVGVRACELAAIGIQDRVFLRSDFSDPIYRSRREGLFIIAVNCLDPDSTCFCTSMGTGPRHEGGFDLCLTELDEVFLVEIGSELGRSLISSRNYSLPSAFMQNTAAQAITRATQAITRKLDTQKLPELMSRCLEADRWDDVAKLCLSCANCTQVCPTCFCWDAVDQVNISARETRRERTWDSCFNPNYSYVFGGNARPSIRSRYRQWLTHKLGTWVEQFGVLGCVGCGRCITWCPAGIDLIEEVTAIRQEGQK